MIWLRRNIIRLLIPILLLVPFSVYSQVKRSTHFSYANSANQNGFFLGIGAGFYDMDGDYGSKQIDVIKTGYSLAAENKFNRYLVIRATVTKATLSQRFIGRFAYFDHLTKMAGAEITCLYLIAPITGCSRKIQIRPFIGLGIGLIGFETFADLFDDTGNRYFFWNDGSVRLYPEKATHIHEAQSVKRDGIFETRIDTLHLYQKVTAVFPGEVGVRLMINNLTSIYFSARYTLSASDYIDHGVAYRDDYLTIRARQNNFPDGYFSYSTTVLFKIQANTRKHHYTKKQRRPKLCRGF